MFISGFSILFHWFMSVFVTLPCFFHYCSFVLYSEVREVIIPAFIFFPPLKIALNILNLLWLRINFKMICSQFSSVAQSCSPLCNSMGCSTPGFPVSHHSWSLLKLMSIESAMPSNHPILCPILLLPSILPSIRVFSSELVLHIRWPKY